MITSPKEWIEVSDNIVAKPFKYGFLGAVSAAILLLMNHFSLVNLQEFGFYFLPVIYIVFAFSSALIIWGVSFTLFLTIRGCLAKVAEKQRKIHNDQIILQTLLENLARLDQEPKLLLLEYMQQPSGRFRAPDMANGYDEFYKLYEENLVNTETRLSKGSLAWNGIRAGEHCRVNWILYNHFVKKDPQFHSYVDKYLS